ncbi:MAG: TPM domain-containing protein [Pseudarcicella sp.]|nr:TPM domain-containing protein [Pseudarcicella sp.]MBP6410393.1 TPM domain-containing protein [Pseudarcicella sp.]
MQLQNKMYLNIKSLVILLATCLYFIIGNIAIAQNTPPKPNPPVLVNDFVNILSTTEKATIENKLKAYSDSTSTQIAIVIVKNTGESDPYDFAIKIAKEWGVGQKEKNNGLLLLWATETRKIRIVTGRGLEGALPDAICKRIINTIIKPYFQAGQYYEGLDLATTEIIKRASGEFEAEPSTDHAIDPFFVFLIILIVLFILLKILARKNNGGGGNGRAFRGNSGWGGPIIFGSGGSSSWGSGGGFDSGGFGGFGGGDFGGGGAGGDY